MRFSLLAFAAGASAAAVAQVPVNSTMGSWITQVTVNADQSLYLTALFISDAYPMGRENTCVDAPNATLPAPKGCDHKDFAYEYDGEYLNLTQSATMPNNMTLFGSAYLPASQDLGDGRFRGQATIEVQKAIA